MRSVSRPPSGRNFASDQTFQVLIDGNLIGSYGGLTGAAYSFLSTIGFSATAGSHTITFQGTISTAATTPSSLMR